MFVKRITTYRKTSCIVRTFFHYFDLEVGAHYIRVRTTLEGL